MTKKNAGELLSGKRMYAVVCVAYQHKSSARYKSPLNAATSRCIHVLVSMKRPVFIVVRIGPFTFGGPGRAISRRRRLPVRSGPAGDFPNLLLEGDGGVDACSDNAKLDGRCRCMIIFIMDRYMM